ncbi:DNA ligase [Operophtera brumata]|uniref:DNA ligase n=1 Tax=Operophtera brumata TaxID=104452 RepID=A0A0L7KUL3_OPEBR|nr:DNA ligase [Operophtera brumata]KOB67776.1 DNA ligase [Operophtera brumata]
MSNEQMDKGSPVAEASAGRRINYKRPRRVYSSSDDDGDDDDTYPPSPKRVPTARDHEDSKYDYLQKQISELKYLITRNYNVDPKPVGNVDLTDKTVEGHAEDDASIYSMVLKPPDKDFEWDEDTITSETTKRTSDSKLNYVRKIQHFDSTDWNNVRYTETQKKYISTPALTNLAMNDELLAFESKFSHLRSLDQTFGALTNMLMAQKEALQVALKNLLEWSSDSETTLTHASLSTKVHGLFSNTCAYTSVSKDILQVVCGRRANIIEHRRDDALSAVKDKYNKTILRKIPPSCDYLFQPKELGDAVTKLGGGSKVFHRPYLPAEGSQGMQNNPRPYPPTEGTQATPRRFTNPAVPFRGYDRNRFQQAPASGKGKSLAGKPSYSAAKNKQYKRPREDQLDRRRQ